MNHPQHRIVRRLSPLLVCALLATAGCGDEGTTPPPAPPVLAATTVLEQSARAGDTVPVAPAVRVTDSAGRPVAGLPVSFYAMGGGTVAAELAVTDGDGRVSAGRWTLGWAAGTNTVRASIAGSPAVTFTAAALDPCTLYAPLAAGGSAGGELDELDCRFAGWSADRFRVEVAAGQSFALHLQGSGAPRVTLSSPAGHVVARETAWGADSTARLQVLALPAGTYTVAVEVPGRAPGGRDTYVLALRAAAADASGCTAPWVAPGTTTAQVLTTGDTCGEPYADRFRVWLRAGQTLSVRQRSGAFNARLRLWREDTPDLIRGEAYGGATDAHMVYSASVAGAYVVEAGADAGPRTGAYTLVVE